MKKRSIHICLVEGAEERRLLEDQCGDSDAEGGRPVLVLQHLLHHPLPVVHRTLCGGGG